jgi:hypothetical protein
MQLRSPYTYTTPGAGAVLPLPLKAYRYLSSQKVSFPSIRGRGTWEGNEEEKETTKPRTENKIRKGKSREGGVNGAIGRGNGDKETKEWEKGEGGPSGTTVNGYLTS